MYASHVDCSIILEATAHSYRENKHTTISDRRNTTQTRKQLTVHRPLATYRIYHATKETDLSSMLTYSIHVIYSTSFPKPPTHKYLSIITNNLDEMTHY